MNSLLHQITLLCDRYYWQTAILIARNGLARQYRNSFLGLLWTLFQPLTMVIVYTTMMPMILKTPISGYTLYVIVSLPVWAFFQVCILGASGSILGNSETLKRCIVSSSLFPIADVLRSGYTFYISFGTIYLLALVMGIEKLDALILLLPLYFIPILIIMGSVAIAIAFIAPYIRDISELATVCMTMLFWLTPVVYQITMLPPEAQMWMKFNPFYIMLHPVQMLVYEHKIPGWEEVNYLVALAAFSLIIGFSIFKLCRRNYVYYL